MATGSEKPATGSAAGRTGAAVVQEFDDYAEAQRPVDGSPMRAFRWSTSGSWDGIRSVEQIMESPFLAAAVWAIITPTAMPAESRYPRGWCAW